MALNTENRRASAIGTGLLFRVVLPTPNAMIGVGDRLQMIALYRLIFEAGGGGGGGTDALFPKPVAILIDGPDTPIATML